MTAISTQPLRPRLAYKFPLGKPAAPAPLNPAGIKLIAAAFASALAAGIKRPKMRIGIFEFVTKPSTSTPRTIHVTRKGLMAGRIVDGEYIGPETWRAALSELCADLRKAVVAHGNATGECSCCGRELSDPVSVRLGIGPVCADRWGFN